MRESDRQACKALLHRRPVMASHDDRFANLGAKSRLDHAPQERATVEISEKLVAIAKTTALARRHHEGRDARRLSAHNALQLAGARPARLCASAPRKGFCLRARMSSARIDAAISAGLTAEMSRPIGARSRASAAGVTPAAARRSTRR